MIALLSLLLLLQIRPQLTPARIIVETSPGAEVVLDGKPIGKASEDGRFTVADVAPGAHVIRVSQEGKRPFTQKFEAAAGATIRIPASLADLAGRLELYTTPLARILIDGVEAGRADADGRALVPKVKQGRRIVRVFRDGYSSREDEVRIRAGETLTTTLELTPVVLPTASGEPARYEVSRTLYGFQWNSVHGAAFVAEGKWLIAGGDDPRNAQIRIWETATGREIRKQRRPDSGGVFDIAVSPDGKLCASRHVSGGDDEIFIWDVATGKDVRRVMGADGAVGVAFSHDGLRLAAGGRPVRIFDVESGSVLFELSGRLTGLVTFSPDGRWIATTDWGVALWNGAAAVTSSTPAVTMTQDNRVWHRSPTFSSDSRWLAAAYQEGVRLWRVPDGQESHALEHPGAMSVAFSPDGRLLVSAGQSMHLWDSATGERLQTFEGKYHKVAFSRDGEWLAGTMDASDGGVRLWRRVK
jgi:WD40 repeat protein